MAFIDPNFKGPMPAGTNFTSGYEKPARNPYPTLGGRVRGGGGYQNPQMHRSAQRGIPYTPNNGNPNGAHNQRRLSNQSGSYMDYMLGRQPRGAGETPADLQSRFEQMMQSRGGYPQLQPGGSFSQPGYGGGEMQGVGAGFQNFYQQQNPYGMGQGYPSMGGGGYPTMQGQNPNLGRYRPPRMSASGNWMDQGPYEYNLPTSYGWGYGPGWG